MRLKFEFYLYNIPIYFVLYTSIGDLNIRAYVHTRVISKYIIDDDI